ncbi:Anthocyanidin 3-O-glucoside 2'''-O-xylosyltransferase [Hibiscus syriacus]|uniref:Anthocyanidin 3-O-glucoside 2'''-O-xylosyltransferase n=1 Tax=Hibiscus syriacus TaxID=106335 RepID=A0A6A2XL55_HIBSY|nr:Anthocyanidin 3-O-glucoside 2'''-O-xylosyltransferase [Hibiscus syriacus]
MTAEEVMVLPPGYPPSTVKLKAEEAATMLFEAEDFGSGLSFQDRIRKSTIGSDAIAIRTSREIEGPFLDYVGKGFGKPDLLTGPCLPETRTQQLDDEWVNWLSQFQPGSVVFCSFGSQSGLQKDEFQELAVGFELSGLPFLVALKPPQGCSTVEEALPEGFQERVKERRLVYGGWVPLEPLLYHPDIGCFVNHCGYGTMWEFLLSDCQIVLIPKIGIKF